MYFHFTKRYTLIVALIHSQFINFQNATCELSLQYGYHIELTDHEQISTLVSYILLIVPLILYE